VLLLLGVDYLRRRWLTLAVAGGIWLVIGVSVFIDALDGVLYFPIHVFAWLLLAEGLATPGYCRYRRGWPAHAALREKAARFNARPRC